MQGAWKVGLLVVIFAGLLLGAYSFLGQSLFAPKPAVYYVEMPDAAGVTPGTRVLLSGVKIGTVASVGLESPRLAKLTLHLDPKQEIPSDSTAQVAGSLIGLGDSPISIVPGKSSTPLEQGSTVVGSRSNPVEEMIPGSKSAIQELEKTLVASQKLMEEITEVVSDKSAIDSVKKLVGTTEKTIGQYGQLAARIDGLVASNQVKLGEAMNSATLAMKDIRASTQAMSRIIADGRWSEKSMALLDNLNTTTQSANKLVTDLDGLVTDPELRASFESTAKNIEAMTDSGTRIAADTEKIAKNGVTISENAAELTSRANGLADEASTILKQLQKIIGKGPSTGAIELKGGIDLLHTTRPNYYRTDLDATLVFKGTPVHFGLYDAFETNKINLQLGKPFGSNGEFRYGIHASKPGAGVDFHLTPSLMLRGDLYDINNPRADVRLRYDLGGGFYGWLGADQVFKRNALLVGVGIRK